MITDVLQPTRLWDGEIPRVQVKFQEMSITSAKEGTSLTRAMLERYRCPEGFFDFRLSEELSPDPGYFQFGPDTTCYGRTLKGAHQTQLSSPLFDTLSSVFVDGEELVLPFDPNEVIDNLRWERYPSSQLSKCEKALKGIYYWLRPLTNRSLRKTIQRLRAANWQKRQFPQWPVDTTVENICEKLLLLSLLAVYLDGWHGASGVYTDRSIGKDFSYIAGGRNG